MFTPFFSSSPMAKHLQAVLIRRKIPLSCLWYLFNSGCIAEPISFSSINNRSNFFKLSSHESARPTSKWRPQKKLFIFEHKVFCFSFSSFQLSITSGKISFLNCSNKLLKVFRLRPGQTLYP